MEFDRVETRAALGANGVQLRLMAKGKARKTLLLEVRQAMDFFSHYAVALGRVLLHTRRQPTPATSTAPLDPRENKQQIIAVLVALHHCCDRYGLSLVDLQAEGRQAYLAHCSGGDPAADTEADDESPT